MASSSTIHKTTFFRLKRGDLHSLDILTPALYMEGRHKKKQDAPNQ